MITLKEMKLTFTIDVENEKLKRTISDMNGNIIWTTGLDVSTKIDVSEEGIQAYEEQMKSLPFWNIVETERIYL